jgi:very-short-patch-repair endonuclease
VVSRPQLVELGFSAEAIRHRLAKGRLHRIFHAAYAVGRPELTREGRWMAAVLSCGVGAALSHSSAAELWGIRGSGTDEIEISIRGRWGRSRGDGIRIHRRQALKATDLTRHRNIPVTTPTQTLVDLALDLSTGGLETSINEADKLGLVSAAALRSSLAERAGSPGVGRLIGLLDRRTFRLTDSELERLLLRIISRAGLPLPATQQVVNGFRVDFYWPDLGLVVETDGLRYHRTAAQQAKDRVRDQAHVAGGVTPLRFTHSQVAYEPDHVRATLRAAIDRLSSRPP